MLFAPVKLTHATGKDRLPMLNWSPRKRSHLGIHLVLAVVLSLVASATLWYLLSRSEDPRALLGFWLLGVNLTTFAYYGWDKWRARHAARRIPELILHTLSVLGGSLGAYTGMRTFRHKTIKGSFRFLFWTIVVLQLVLVGWVVKWWFEHFSLL